MKKRRSEALDMNCRICGKRKAQDGSVCLACADAAGQPAPRARARKITPEAVGELCRLVSQGMPLDHACARVGFRRQSLDEARSKDADLDEQVRSAQADGAEWYRSQVMHADDDWKRWAWLAERLHPSMFAPPRQRVDTSISGPDGGPVKAETTITISRDEAISIARRKDTTK